MLEHKRAGRCFSLQTWRRSRKVSSRSSNHKNKGRKTDPVVLHTAAALVTFAPTLVSALIGSFDTIATRLDVQQSSFCHLGSFEVFTLNNPVVAKCRREQKNQPGNLTARLKLRSVNRSNNNCYRKMKLYSTIYLKLNCPSNKKKTPQNMPFKHYKVKFRLLLHFI